MKSSDDIPSFLINDDDRQDEQDARGRPQLTIDPPSDPFIDNETRGSSDMVSINFHDAIGTPLLRPSSRSTSRSRSRSHNRSGLHRRSRSLSSDRSLLNPKASPLQKIASSAKRMSTESPRSPDISFMNELTEPGIDDFKADLVSALGTSDHEGAWLPVKKQESNSRNSSTSNLIESEEVFELNSLDKKPPPSPTGPKGVTFQDNLSVNNDSLRPLTPTQQSTVAHSPSKTIEDVFHEFTSKVKSVRRPDGRQSRQDAGNASPLPHSGLETSDEEDDNDYLPLEGLGVNVGTQEKLVLYGKSVRLFSPTSRLRLKLASILLKTWPYHTIRLIILFQTALLSYRQWNPYKLHGYVKYGPNWADWVLYAVNFIYTIEIVSKIIAFGLWDDSEMFKALDKDYAPITEILRLDKIRHFIFGAPKQETTEFDLKPAALKHSVTFKNNISKHIPIQRAFLRSSWNRLDFVSTVFFWIDFFFSINRFNATRGVPVFRALACLRILRLVDVTDRISLILKSIKNGAPQLLDVILFLLYFWVLFAIIGVQSFKSSLRRTCVWTNPDDSSETYRNSEQYCGGYLQPGTLKKMPYLDIDGLPGDRHKGFLCPVYSKCMTTSNPYGGTVSFDNILYSMEMVFVVMSANTFTDIMYDLMNTDSMAASLFFIFGIFFLFLWMINLLIAVISASFKATREEEEKKTGGHKNMTDFDLNWTFPNTIFSRIYLKIKWIFEVAILISLILQGRTTKDTTGIQKHDFYKGECAITLLLLAEIIFRFSLYHPKSLDFFKDKRNCLDLFLAIITSLMIIPPVYNNMGRAYDWLRAFQILRFYRIVLTFKFARQLWAQVWSTITIIINLALFYFLLLFLSSIIISRYFEGFVPEDEVEDNLFSLQSLPNTFAALYTITSTENWTDVLYLMQQYSPNSAAVAFGACLLIGWFLLSNSVVLNLFIAIIADSLEVSENEKRKEQVRKFVLVDFPRKVKSFAEKTFLSEFKSKIFKVDRVEDNQKQVMNLLLNGVAIQEFLKDELEEQQNDTALNELPSSKTKRFFKVHSKRLLQFSWFRTIFNSLFWSSHVGENPFYTRKNQLLQVDGDFTLLPKTFEVETRKTIEARRKFLEENPGFNTAFYILAPNQPLRKLCQRITSPSVGKRYDGVEPNKYLHAIFVGLIAISTMALVVIACYTTPLYRKKYSFDNEVWNWPFAFEVAFAILFLLEFLIKTIADGLIFTPNAYFQNSWNCIDFVVLISLWINVIAIWKGDDSLSRIVRGLKALRALRLLTISDTSKDIFHKVLIVGVWKIVNAAFLSFTLLFPFAIWGLNLFAGRLGVCNDNSVDYLDCKDEYTNEAFDWDILMPRAYGDPQLEFNKFSSSLLTLFEILSLEGWVDLLENIVNSTGVGTLTGYWATPGDAVFIIAFNFLGIVFVLALFVSVIINNYSKTTGSAFLTLQQRSWTEVQKLLSQAHPRKRPSRDSVRGFKKLCFELTVERNTYVNTFLHLVLWVHILAILLEMFPSPSSLDTFRYTIYITSSSIFSVYILMKLYAIGFKSFFKVKWNVYQLFVFLGAWATSMGSFFTSRDTEYANINKLFLVGIFTVLIPSSNRLSHLLKVASASIPSLLSLIFTWGILFLVFAIALNQIFGLTRTGSNTGVNLNLRTVTKSLLLLFRGSFGEGWNYTMRDFAVDEPYCSQGAGFSNTDCGSKQYAYILFIFWNILSMYIFVNMFISLIFENFSYVYSDNGSKVTLNREEIRKFKAVWQMFDPHGTGYISPSQLPQFLRSLDGYFSFKIYEGKWTIPELKKKWFEVPENSTDPYDVFVNFAEVNKTLGKLDVKKVKDRIRAYDRFIEEAILNMELNDEKGIAFWRIILQIPLYSRFEESNCLTLSDFMDRLLVSRKVDKRLQGRRQLAALEMVTFRWRFKHRHDVNSIYSASVFSGSSSQVGENPFDGRSLLSQSRNPFGAPAIVVTENDNPAKDYFNYRKDTTPSRKREITGSLEMPSAALASPIVTTPDKTHFTTDDSYWSPPKKNIHPGDDQELFDNISELSETLSQTEWGDLLKEMHSEQQPTLDRIVSRVNRNKKEKEDAGSNSSSEEDETMGTSPGRKIL